MVQVSTTCISDPLLSFFCPQVLRSQLPTLELDSVFEAKEELAMAVKSALAVTMSSYGYQIVQVLITDLDPDQRVKNAMNEINSSKRLKFAIAERAEGDKVRCPGTTCVDTSSPLLSPPCGLRFCKSNPPKQRQKPNT